MSSESKSKGKASILMLGCGLVAPPAIHYLAEAGFEVVCASRTLEKTKKVIANIPLARAVEFDIEQKDAMEKLEKLIPEADLVISLLPYIYHVQAAAVAIKHKKHFCTTSYVSEAMSLLDGAAKDAGVIVLNECGVDPGLDHMSAQKIIDEVHAKGGKVVSFTSICGGLPAPSADNNPLHYKLSWSPRGVLLASSNNATFLEGGKVVKTPGRNLFDPYSYKHDIVDELGDMEWYPNRDSVKYRDTYNIPEVETLIRGTYRRPGWCSFMEKVTKSGLLSQEVDESLPGKTYAQFCQQMFQLGTGLSLSSVKSSVAKKLGVPEDGPIMSKLEWLGLFKEDKKIPAGANTSVDALCVLFQENMQYAPGEKDMLCMKHTFEIEYSNSHRECITSTMVDYGLQPKGFSSMARTVSLPLAIAVKGILEGTIKLRGLQTPISPDLYTPILAEMETLGVKFVEKTLPTQIWARSEVKPGEERCALPPSVAANLVKAGYRVVVERSPHRCIPDAAYEGTGVTMADTDSWKSAPNSAIILGLKELPEDIGPLHHRHIHFAHCYKQQGGWQNVLGNFFTGKGLLWDLEFLQDDKGRRVAAFGQPAGVVGMAVGLLTWACQELKESVPELKSWKSAADMVSVVSSKVAAARKSSGKPMPSVLIIGALGRCGGGAVWTAKECGLETIVKWDLEETRAGGPFNELLDYDIVVNCIYLSAKIAPFLTSQMIGLQRKLTVLVDVSCDTSNPNNPFPIYNKGTDLWHPTLRVKEAEKSDDNVSGAPLDVIAIDHLPSLLPVESSENYAQAMRTAIAVVDALVASNSSRTSESAV